MRKIGGCAPIISYRVSIFDQSGYSETICTLEDVPFFGTWLEDDTIKVSTVWDTEDLTKVNCIYQDWDEVAVITTLKVQLARINSALQDQVVDSPWHWTIDTK